MFPVQETKTVSDRSKKRWPVQQPIQYRRLQILQTLIRGGRIAPFTSTEAAGQVKSVCERRWVLEHHSASRSSEEA